MKNSQHCNDKSKKLIFIGSNSAIQKEIDICNKVGIEVAGIIDSDYYGNTDFYNDIPIIDSEENLLNDKEIAEYYRKNYNFFCSTKWIPETNSINNRNTKKRFELLDNIEELNLNCISLIDPLSSVSPTANIGRSVVIDSFVVIEPFVEIDDFCSIYTQSVIGHHAKISRNSVVQRRSGVTTGCLLEENVYMGINSYVLKANSVIKRGTFIHEKMYVRRHTEENEIIERNGKNMRKVYPS